MLGLLLFALLGVADVRPGELVPDVKCEADSTQSYALYLPRAYTSSRTYPVIFAFDPGARGRVAVERYQAAAEQYGYIVAGSNNSRNGVPLTSRTITAMTDDVTRRFHVDTKRVYLAGMSGGARVALSVALAAPGQIAGVIASSAGYPDAAPRKTLPFPLFATAGTDDFNHLEMRLLDAALTTPHRLVVFEGGHGWLPSDLAIEAIEWMELQAIKSGLKARDEAEIEALFAKRMAADTNQPKKQSYLNLRSIASDFAGLRDVQPVAARAAALEHDNEVQTGLKQDRDADEREERTLRQIRLAETRLQDPGEKPAALAELRRRWKELAETAKQPQNSIERQLARRVLSILTFGATTTDASYRSIIDQYGFVWRER